MRCMASNKLLYIPKYINIQTSEIDIDFVLLILTICKNYSIIMPVAVSDTMKIKSLIY